MTGAEWLLLSRPLFSASLMDFSKFNAAEQAHLSRVIEKKQVRLPALCS